MQHSRGFVLIVGIIMLIVVSGIGIVTMSTVLTEQQTTRNFSSSLEATQSCQAAIRKAHEYIAGLPTWPYPVVNDLGNNSPAGSGFILKQGQLGAVLPYAQNDLWWTDNSVEISGTDPKQNYLIQQISYDVNTVTFVYRIHCRGSDAGGFIVHQSDFYELKMDPIADPNPGKINATRCGLACINGQPGCTGKSCANVTDPGCGCEYKYCCGANGWCGPPSDGVYNYCNSTNTQGVFTPAGYNTESNLGVAGYTCNNWINDYTASFTFTNSTCNVSIYPPNS